MCTGMGNSDPVRARLIDVSREAGVHVSTVSKVLNGQGVVREETRRRIYEAAVRLKYRPNILARGLKTNATGAFGMLVPSLRNPVYASIVRGAVHQAAHLGYVVVLAEDEGADTEQGWERLVESGRIDGIIIASASPGSPILDLAASSKVPYVYVNRRVLGSGRNVFMREEDAGRIAAEHLLEFGHRRLAQISGPIEFDTARRRAEGFAGAARVAGLAHPQCVEAAFDERGGYAAMAELLASGERPTGVFVSNLNQAIGALSCVRRSAIEVPTQISIVAYDDDPMAEYLEVPLTCIRMPLAELGSAGVDALLSQLSGQEPTDSEVDIAPVLVKRGSSGPAPEGN